MAKKTAARKKAARKKTPARKKTAKQPASRRLAPAPLPRGAVRASLVLELRHVRLLEELGRAYGLAGSQVDLAAVMREVLDRYGHRLLRLATPRRGIDEEE